MTIKLFTIDHSNHSIKEFVALLKKHRITAIADVRSQPYSCYTPHFNQNSLKQYLKSVDIAYVFLGQELGARREITYTKRLKSVDLFLKQRFNNF